MPPLNVPQLGLDGLPVNRYDLLGNPWNGGYNLDGSPRGNNSFTATYQIDDINEGVDGTELTEDFYIADNPEETV